MNPLKPVWYRWYCNKCGSRGKTTNRDFECCPLSTRVVIDDDPEQKVIS